MKTHNKLVTWNIRSYQAGDEQKICELYKYVFPEEMNLAEWRWRYQANPVRAKAISLAQSEHGELVGQYALMPVTMKIGENESVGTFSLNTMTHPEYRNQGIFTKLAKHNYAHLKQHEMHLTFGFPNINSHHGIIQNLGWRDLAAHVPIYAAPLKMKSLLQRKIASRFFVAILSFLLEKLWQTYNYLFHKYPFNPKEISIQKVDKFDDRWNQLWAEVSGALPIAVKRDQQYLEWRYLANPLFSYNIFAAFNNDKLVGYCVASSGEKFDVKMGYIVDILATSPAISGALIKYSLKFHRENNCDVVSILMTPFFAKKHLLRKLGFFKLANWLLPQKMFFGACLHSDKISADFAFNVDNWYITWGDHDRV